MNGLAAPAIAFRSGSSQYRREAKAQDRFAMFLASKSVMLGSDGEDIDGISVEL